MTWYTVNGLWLGDEPVVAGVLEGQQDFVDSDPCDERFQGRWAVAVEADSSDEAETLAIADRVATWTEGGE